MNVSLPTVFLPKETRFVVGVRESWKRQGIEILKAQAGHVFFVSINVFHLLFSMCVCPIFSVTYWGRAGSRPHKLNVSNVAVAGVPLVEG